MVVNKPINLKMRLVSGNFHQQTLKCINGGKNKISRNIV